MFTFPTLHLHLLDGRVDVCVNPFVIFCEIHEKPTASARMHKQKAEDGTWVAFAGRFSHEESAMHHVIGNAFL